jgi:hypothetical protein
MGAVLNDRYAIILLQSTTLKLYFQQNIKGDFNKRYNKQVIELRFKN